MKTTLLKQGTLLEERLAQTARRKRPSRAQVRLAREFDSDIARFERGFRVDVLKVLESMGRELQEIANQILEPEPGKSNKAYGFRVTWHSICNIPYETIYKLSREVESKYQSKDAQQDAMDAALITERLNIAGFEAELAVVYEKHYKRILKATESRVNAVMELGISISEPLEAEILAAGGKRVGLLDMTGKTRRKVFEQLSVGRADGEAVAQLARRLREFVPAGRFKSAKTRAMLIARTETGNAQKVAAAASYREAGVTEVLIMDARLGDTDDECEALNGVVVSLAEGEALMEDEHPNGTRRMVAQPPPIENF